MAQRRRIDDAPGQEADRTISGVTGRTPAAVAGDESHGAVAGAEVGVGPWPGGPDTWPDDPRLDPDLLAHGDRRNVIDRYRYWRMEAIVADLDRTRVPLQVAIQNWEHDFNIGSIVRTANAFNLAGVHVVGRRRWNRRGAMVTDRYLHVHHHESVADFLDWLAEHDVTPVGVDNLAAAIGEARDTIEDVLEPYLIQQGYLQRTLRGRIATPAIYRHLGLAGPNSTVVRDLLAD